MFQAVVFDVDGTLLDSVDSHARAWVETFRRFKYDISFEQARNEIGKGSDQYLQSFLKPEEIERDGEAMTRFRADLFKKKYLPHVEPFPFVRELFERIAASGKAIALATSAEGDELDEYIKRLHVGDLLHAHTSSADAERSKPEPDIFEAALERLDVKGREAIVVGDSRYDAQAALKTGATPVGLLCGGFEEEDLRANGFVEIYRDPADLLERFDGSMLAR